VAEDSPPWTRGKKASMPVLGGTRGPQRVARQCMCSGVYLSIRWRAADRSSRAYRGGSESAAAHRHHQGRRAFSTRFCATGASSAAPAGGRAEQHPGTAVHQGTPSAHRRDTTRGSRVFSTRLCHRCFFSRTCRGEAKQHLGKAKQHPGTGVHQGNTLNPRP